MGDGYSEGLWEMLLSVGTARFEVLPVFML